MYGKFSVGNSKLILGSLIVGSVINRSGRPSSNARLGNVINGSSGIGRLKLRLGIGIVIKKFIPRSGIFRLKLGRSSNGRLKLSDGNRIENGNAKLHKLIRICLALVRLQRQY